MKKCTRLIASFLACAVLPLTLAACGGNTASSGSSQGATSTQGESASTLSGEINFWTLWNESEPLGMAYQEIADNFEKEFPGTKINIQFCGRDLQKIMPSALEAGEAIDLFDYPSAWGSTYLDYCSDLGELAERKSDILGGQSIADVALPAMLATPKVLIESDVQYTIGYKPYMSVFMYNSNLFKEVGIESEPATWEELDAACAKLKAAGYSPITFDDAYALWLPGQYLMRLKGADWVKELVFDETGEMWHDEAVMTMAKAFEDFASKGYFDANISGNKWPAGQIDLGNNKIGMYLNLTGLTVELADVVDENFVWDAFNFPDVVPGSTDAATKGVVLSSMLAIHRDTQNRDLVEAFVTYLYREQSQTSMVEVGQVTPALKGFTWPAELENIKPLFETTTEILPLGGGIQANGDLSPIMSETFTKLAAGQITAEEFCDTMATAAKQ